MIYFRVAFDLLKLNCDRMSNTELPLLYIKAQFNNSEELTCTQIIIYNQSIEGQTPIKQRPRVKKAKYLCFKVEATRRSEKRM